MIFDISTIGYISSKTEQSICRDIVKKKIYTMIESSEAERMSKKYNVSPTIVECIYANYVQERIVVGFRRIKHAIALVCNAYNDGVDIAELSRDFDYPALTIMRLILIERKCNEKIIKNMLKMIENNDASGCITTRDVDQIQQAYKVDHFTRLDQKSSLERSIQFEQKVEDVLARLGIAFQTQEELIIAQKKKDGRVTNTPDFLLVEPVTINGIVIHWIEVKNYFGSNTYFIHSQIQEQITRYYNKWGSGCLIFSIGCVDKLATKLKDERPIIVVSFDDFFQIKKIE